MEAFLKRLQGLGGLFGFAANAITFLAANWPLVVSAGIAVWATTVTGLFKIAVDPHVQVAVGVFLVILWTYIGLRFLSTLNGTANVRLVPDYRYGISPEGYAIAFDEENEDVCFNIGVAFRNHLNTAIKLKVEQFRVVLGDRTCPESQLGEIIIPRVAVRGIKSSAFKRDAVRDKMTGTIDLVLIYGDPEGEFKRRFHYKVNVNIALLRDKDGKFTNASVSDEHILSDDMPL